MGGEIEQVFFFLGGRGQPREIHGIDDHVTSRAGHHPLACAFERLARRPSNVKQPLTGLRFHFLVEGSVGPEETNDWHRVWR